jgi:PAS domain-containing protein
MAPRESSSPEAIPAILRYSIAVLSVAIATGAAFFLTHFSATLTPFLLAVGATVWYAGVGPGFLAVTLSVLSLDFFFVSPSYSSFSFRQADLVYLVLCIAVALVVGRVAAARLRAEREIRQAHDALDAKVSERTAELRESEGKLEEAQRIARVGYWERDVRTGLVNWSEQSNRIFGLAPNEGPVPIARYQELVHPEGPAGYSAPSRTSPSASRRSGRCKRARRDTAISLSQPEYRSGKKISPGSTPRSKS